jgi:hypothetical protein
MLVRCRRISSAGTKFYVTGKNILAATVPVLVNDKYFKMHEAAKRKLFKMKTKI